MCERVYLVPESLIEEVRDEIDKNILDDRYAYNITDLVGVPFADARVYSMMNLGCNYKRDCFDEYTDVFRRTIKTVELMEVENIVYDEILFMTSFEEDVTDTLIDILDI